MTAENQPAFRQREQGVMRYPASGPLRWLFKAPLIAWRLGLGPLLSWKRMLVLTTRGRKTGRARHTMLEHTVVNGIAYLAPGWGERTLWYQNIVADPHVTVQPGGRTYGARAIRVTDDSELASLYAVAHGKSSAWTQYLNSWDVQDNVEDYVAKKHSLIVLRLDPIEEIPLPPLPKDLVWVWPAIVAAAATLWYCARRRGQPRHE